MEPVIHEQPGLAFLVVLVLVAAVCYIVQVMARHWQAVRQFEQEAILKEQMIQRGMSAREIIDVLQGEQVAVVHDSPAGNYPAGAYRYPRRPASNRGWLLVVLGIPVMLIVLCGGMLSLLSSSVSMTNEVVAPAAPPMELFDGPVGPESPD